MTIAATAHMLFRAMGYNTAVVVMNDALGSIEKDPDFGKNLAKAILSRGPSDSLYEVIPAGSFCNAAVVVGATHSSSHIMVQVGGNSGKTVKFDEMSAARVAAERERQAIIADLKEGIEVFELAWDKAITSPDADPLEAAILHGSIVTLQGVIRRIKNRG